jgi:hypothetical protein
VIDPLGMVRVEHRDVQRSLFEGERKSGEPTGDVGSQGGQRRLRRRLDPGAGRGRQAEVLTQVLFQGIEAQKAEFDEVRPEASAEHDLRMRRLLELGSRQYAALQEVRPESHHSIVAFRASP